MGGRTTAALDLPSPQSSSESSSLSSSFSSIGGLGKGGSGGWTTAAGTVGRGGAATGAATLSAGTTTIISNRIGYDHLTKTYVVEHVLFVLDILVGH